MKSQMNQNETKIAPVGEIRLEVESDIRSDCVAWYAACLHREIELEVEELEEVIAPGVKRNPNHNETLVSDSAD